MEKPITAVRIQKIIIDAILGLLYLLLLGYAFTGGKAHEAAAVVFAIVVVIHNIVNIRWYKALNKGGYTGKRRLGTVINIALLADMTTLLATGILNSRYLFPTVLSLTNIGQIHKVLAMIGFVLIVLHVSMHIFAKNNKRLVLLAVAACIFALLLDLSMLPYLKRHFLTVEIDRDSVISGERIDFGNRKILTVYFTRVGNTDFEDGIDAVSGASLLLDEDGDLLGNSQVIGQMIQNAVGGDMISINTKKRYPSSYSATISVAGDEMAVQELPELIDMPINLDVYDTVFIVFPLWMNTIPKPVEAFLKNYDFSEKTVISVVTHGGGGTGKSIEAIKAVCSGTIVEDSLEIYCDDIPYCRERITKWLNGIHDILLKSKTPLQARHLAHCSRE